MRHFLVLLLVSALAGCGAAVKAGREIMRESARQRERAERDRDLPDLPRAPFDVTREHPRLMLLSEDVDRIRSLVREDPVAARWLAHIQSNANQYLNAERLSEPRGAMLSTSRQALVRVPTLAAMYRITGDDRYGKRAVAEMVHLSRFRNWGTQDDFLAIAEMTTAVSIGYDWTFGVMSPGERATIADAIARKGLRAGIHAYDSDAGWTLARHNWNLVCNSGMIVGALAVAEEEPRVAREVLERARRSIRFGVSGFAPDGAWEEGPTYWNYSTRYLAFALAALETAAGTDWGILDAPGVAETGLFRIHTNGPTDLPFDFADGEPVIGNSSQLFWLAHALNRPEYAAFEQAQSERDPAIFDLLWYRPSSARSLERLALDATFLDVELVSLRGSWTDRNATWIAMKGGSNEAHHGHLDLGTFVLDALNQRWAIDMGADDYELPEYFGNRRWSYYRNSTRGHNTLLLGGRNQRSDATAPIVAFSSRPRRAHAVIDLSRGYSADATRVHRGVALIDRTHVLIQDELSLRRATDIVWSMHTRAEVELQGTIARLRQGGRLLTMHLLSPTGASFELEPVRLAKPQQSAAGVRKLLVRLPKQRGSTRIAILLAPDAPALPEVTIHPLDRW